MFYLISVINILFQFKHIEIILHYYYLIIIIHIFYFILILEWKIPQIRFESHLIIWNKTGK